MSDPSTQSRTTSIAVFLLGSSAMYSLVVEVWSAPILFIDTRGLAFVVSLVAGILLFYALYGWLIVKTSQGLAAARYALITIIITGISVHAILALTPSGELFGPILVTAILDGLRIIAVILLLAAPRRIRVDQSSRDLPDNE